MQSALVIIKYYKSIICEAQLHEIMLYFDLSRLLCTYFYGFDGTHEISNGRFIYFDLSLIFINNKPLIMLITCLFGNVYIFSYFSFYTFACFNSKVNGYLSIEFTTLKGLLKNERDVSNSQLFEDVNSTIPA